MTTRLGYQHDPDDVSAQPQVDTHALSIFRNGLAERANRAADASRVPGAPRLHARSRREAVQAWLQWNDPNGSHTDVAAAMEDAEPYNEAEAWLALADMLEGA